MALNWGFTLIAENVGITIEIISLILFFLGSLFFFARDFRLGAIMLFIFSGLNFMGAYNFDLNYAPALVVMFISIILMAFSFYGSGGDQAIGGLT